MSNDLRSTAWLPLNDGSSVAPADCISLDGLQPVITRLRQTGAAIAHKDDLLADVVKHPNWKNEVRPLCPTGNRLFEKIGGCLEGQADYVLGCDLFSSIRDFSIREFVDLFSSADNVIMPIADLVSALLDNSQMKDPEVAVKNYILPKVERSLSPERYVRVLKYLSSGTPGGTTPARLREVFKHYLDEALKLMGSQSLLPQIQLCNRNHKWVSPTVLTYFAANISPENILDETQQGILERYEPRAVSSFSQSPVEAPEKFPFDEQASATSALVFWDNLKQWRADDVPEDALAAMVAILGDQEVYRELYTRLSSQRLIAGMWHKLGISGAGKRFHIQVADTTSVTTINLLGEEFAAAVHNDIDAFFDPFPRIRKYIELANGEQLYQLRIRPCNTNDFGCGQKLRILGNTVRAILSHVWQRNIDFDALWEALTKAEQLDIEVAQQSILESSPVLLDNQLSVSDSIPLKEIFQRLHAEKIRKLVAERDGNPTELIDAIDKQKSLRDRLRKYLVTDQETQSLLIGKIQTRLKSQSYESVSIPFELFQNADDAIVELEELCDGTMLPGIRPESLQHSFRIEIDADTRTLRFFHWGRAINQFRVGERTVDGYNRDMEKMLVLQGSGKDATAADRTGQFGLGFKSVFFVCDEPKVLSGSRSRFCVKSGVYPERLCPEDEDRLRQILVKCEEKDPCTGTVIELRCRDKICPQNVVQRFADLSGYLVLFSRRIRNCHVISRRSESWHYKPVEIIPHVERVFLKSAIATSALLFRVHHEPLSSEPNTDQIPEGSDLKHNYRTVLIHWDTDGLPKALRSSSSDVNPKFPEIWITTPTGHEGTGTILINADFDVNPGRTQLRDTKHNQTVVQEMGTNLGKLLCALHRKFVTDWATFRTMLQLNDDVTAEDFWKRFWQACIPYVSRNPKDPIRTILFGENCGINTLIHCAPAIPTGLPRPFDGLVKFSEIMWQTAGLLADEKCWKKCAAIEWIATSVMPGSIISLTVAKDISQFTELKSEELSLARTMKEILKLDAHFPIERAAAIGAVVNDNIFPEADWSGDTRRVRIELRSATFQTEADTKSHARELRVIHDKRSGIDNEERMRARFAPDANVLSASYTGTAVSFFLTCRGAVDDAPDVLADWCFAAALHGEKRKAVAEYLARGAKGYELQQQFASRPSEFQSSWLGDEERCKTATAHLTENERTVAYGRMNRSVELAPQSQSADTPVRSKRPEKDIFQDIESWWNENRENLQQEHDQRVYPFGRVPVIDLNATPSQLESDPAIRREWLLLLIRGQVFRLGHDDDQQRGFLEFFSERRFLDLFAETTFHSEDFISAIDEYLNLSGPLQVYFHWMNQMLAYYQLSRWLPRYATAFASATRPGAVLTDLGNLRDITNLPDSNLYSRSTGFDAPASARAFSLGAHFILREIVRARFRSSLDYRVDPKICQLSYVPSESVKRLFLQITGNEAFALADDHEILSKAMFSTVTEHVEDPTFSSCFDIPFRMLTWDTHAEERREFLGIESRTPADVGDASMSPNADSGVTW